VVVDEISGQHIALLPLLSAFRDYAGWKYLLLGFILFRVFDIVKPWPARQAEKWPNGWGIMADDWFCGIYAALILWAVKALGWL
jgi:phosphatidylglycerophosphatase A